MPAEAHIAKPTRPNVGGVVRWPVVLTNTSDGWLCFDLDTAGDDCGLQITAEFDPAEQVAPIDLPAASLDWDRMRGAYLGPGESVSDRMFLEFQLTEDAEPGAQGTFLFKLTVADPEWRPNRQTATVPIDVVVRKSGLPTLISMPIEYPSEER